MAWLDWLDGWTTTWNDCAGEEERQTAVKLVTLDARSKRVHATGAKLPPPGLFLMELPADLLERLTLKVLSIDRKGSRWARTCTTSLKLYCDARAQLESEGMAWWTGSGRPMRPPAVPDLPWVDGVAEVSASPSKLVHGMDNGDVARIRRGWLTNFSIDAILLALDCPTLRRSYVVPPTHHEDGTLVLSACLGGFAQHPAWLTGAWISENKITFPTTCFWGRADVCEQIANTAVLLAPLHVGSNHWVLARVSQAHSLVEVFNSLPSPHNAGSCPELKGLLQILEGCGVKGAHAFRVVFHCAHPAWTQTDSVSCGIYCAVVAAALVHGRRVLVRQRDIKKWRKCLVKVVLAEIESVKDSPHKVGQRVEPGLMP